jgi:hypothetical protein
MSVLSDSNDTGHRQFYPEFISLAGLNRLAACSTGTKRAALLERRLMDGKFMLGISKISIDADAIMRYDP